MENHLTAYTATALLSKLWLPMLQRYDLHTAYAKRVSDNYTHPRLRCNSLLIYNYATIRKEYMLSAICIDLHRITKLKKK